MKKSYILFLAGGKWQEPWIRFLKDKNHQIILVDPNQEPPCKPYSDLYIRCDVKDVSQILRSVEELNVDIAFVTSDQTDVTTLPVAILSEKFGTPHIPVEVVERFSNKLKCREFIAERFGNDRLPQFKKFRTRDELLHFCDSVDSDVIVKPVDAQSSRGIFVVPSGDEYSDLEPLIENALAASSCDYLIVEEFIKGREITVEGMVINGKHRILAVSGKTHFRTGIASNLQYPLDTDDHLMTKIDEFHNAVIEAAGLQCGLTHTEYLIDEQSGGFYMVEMACRGGGTLISSDIVPWISGVNTYEVLYRQLKGLPVSLSIDEERNTHALLHFFEFPAGTVKSVTGEAEAKVIAGVRRLELEFKAGDVVHAANDDRERQGFALIVGESTEAIADTLDQIYNTISITYAPQEQRKEVLAGE